MKRSVVILLNVGFWACYIGVILILLLVYYRSSAHAINHLEVIWNAFANLLFFAIFPSLVSYLFYYLLLFPRYIQQGKTIEAIVAGLAVSALAASLGYLFLRYLIESGQITDLDDAGRNGRGTAVRVIVIMTAIGVIFGIVGLVIRGFITWVSEIKVKQMLQEKNHEMEMALIKSQIDPHLLFNTINNIDTLIQRDPVKASDYLNKLSDLMRFVLYETGSAKIPLSREIEYIQKYIDLQKIRTSNETYVDLTVTGHAEGRQIAPMVLIPFIENAFKHTNNKKLQHAIAINIVIGDTDMEMICKNRFEVKTDSPADSGLGNELINKRLELIYRGKHRLEVLVEGEVYTVHLTIPHE